MFTWSLAWASSPARLAITSFAFMFDEVPDPVWKTSMGNWSSCSPFATSSPARAMRSATSASRSPSSALTRAAAALIRPSQCTTGAGTRSPDTGKFSRAFDVSTPHSSCRIAMSWRLSTPPTRPDPPPVCALAAPEHLGLLLQPAHELGPLAALSPGAPAGRAHQVAEPELGLPARAGARRVGEAARGRHERSAHALELVGVARLTHARGELGAVKAHRGRRRAERGPDVRRLTRARGGQRPVVAAGCD